MIKVRLQIETKRDHQDAGVIAVQSVTATAASERDRWQVKVGVCVIGGQACDN